MQNKLHIDEVQFIISGKRAAYLWKTETKDSRQKMEEV